MEQLEEIKSTTGDNKLVTANYNKLSDHIRRITPQGLQCSVFCGGTNCKYENPGSWSADSLAIQGLYSHWITDSVLAMARPSTILIIQKNIIQQFQSLGIKSVINLQCAHEHSSCGQPLENSGFSYDPNLLMENNIYYYNFEWKDYGEATLYELLNMVKVVAFATTEGRVAIHCHAGLGRTGVLIACYLIYSLRVQANAAIKYVRLRRPGSVQTRGQILCIRHFAQYILPNLVTFYIRDTNEKDKYMTPFTLSRFLKRQKIALHGYEERNYKYLPKIIHKICERILKLCGCWINDFPSSILPFTTDFLIAKTGVNVQRHESIYSLCSNLEDLGLLSPTSVTSPTSSVSDAMSLNSAPPSPNPSDGSDVMDSFTKIEDDPQEELLMENECYQELEFRKSFIESKMTDESIELHDIRNVMEILIMMDFTQLHPETKRVVRNLQREINQSQVGWAKLDLLNDVEILTALLYDWLESMKKPVLERDDLEIVVIHHSHTEACFTKLQNEAAYLVEYLLIFVSKLQTSASLHCDLIKRMLAALTQQYVMISDIPVPGGRGFCKLREGTTACALKFLNDLFTLVDLHHRQKISIGLDDRDACKSDDDDLLP